MQCSFCGQEQTEVWRTTSGKSGCQACTSRLASCCRCHVLIEADGGRHWDDGLAYCNRCARGQSKCSWCERPAFELASGGDRVICVYCAHHFPHCDQCASLIHADCLTYLDKVYCRPCGDKYPLCLNCASAIVDTAECPQCQGPARACGHCGNLFADRWMIHDSTWYCLGCYWKVCGRCRFCQEPKAADGDTRCARCLEKRVVSLAVAQDLLDEVQWFCREELGLSVKQPYKLKLVDSPAAIPKLHTDAYTLSLSTVGLWAPRERTMWVIKGYPFWFTSIVLAHEHAHAWQQENCPPQSQDLLEGFAAWVEWRVCTNLGYLTFAENMVTLPCPIYGRGLRRCLKLEKQVGAHALVDKIRRLRGFSLWTSLWALLDEV